MKSIKYFFLILLVLSFFGIPGNALFCELFGCEPQFIVGPGTFLGLTDTPSSYSGQANKFVVVDPTEQSLVFKDANSALNDTYIRTDGNSTTTASIPFAQGTSVPDNAPMAFGTGKDFNSSFNGKNLVFGRNYSVASSNNDFEIGAAAIIGDGLLERNQIGSLSTGLSTSDNDLLAIAQVQPAGSFDVSQTRTVTIVNERHSIITSSNSQMVFNAFFYGLGIGDLTKANNQGGVSVNRFGPRIRVAADYEFITGMSGVGLILNGVDANINRLHFYNAEGINCNDGHCGTIIDFYAGASTKDTGVLLDDIGLYVQERSAGSNSNWGIYDEGNPVALGGSVSIGKTTVPTAALDVDGNAYISGNLSLGASTDSNLMAGDINANFVFASGFFSKSPPTLCTTDNQCAFFDFDNSRWEACQKNGSRWTCQYGTQEFLKKLNSFDKYRSDYAAWLAAKAACEDDTHSYSGFKAYQQGNAVCFFDLEKDKAVLLRLIAACNGEFDDFNLDLRKCTFNEQKSCESKEWQFWRSGQCYSNPRLNCEKNPANRLKTWDGSSCVEDSKKACESDGLHYWDGRNCQENAKAICLQDRSKEWVNGECVDLNVDVVDVVP